MPPVAQTPRQGALRRLLERLKRDGYRFITPGLNTHQRVWPRGGATPDLRDVFGWSRPFARGDLPAGYLADLEAAYALRRMGDRLISDVRVSSLGEDLFLHSAYPPPGEDAVFFGPDTYRFARFLSQALAGVSADSVVDIGTGAGPGALVAARATGARRVVGLDVNARALELAAVNLAAGGIEAELALGAGLEPLAGNVDLVVANPPFIAGSTGRTYSEGGDMHGARLSLDWALAGADRLNPGGRVALYTGSAIVGGEDRLRAALEAGLDRARFSLAYEEIDPDIFGEQLNSPGYEDVERIAAVGAVIVRKA